jgi:hypothetical protein
MELILRQDVQNLGFDDIVSVKMDTVVTFNPTGLCSFSYFICKESIS